MQDIRFCGRSLAALRGFPTDAIYVLHAFQKKTQKTRKQDLDAAKQVLMQLLNEV